MLNYRSEARFRLNIMMCICGRRRLASEMNPKICLLELFPRSFSRWRNLALFGDHLDDFIYWLRNQGYAIASVRNYLNALPKLVHWLQHRSVSSLAELTQQELRAARKYYRSREPNVGCAVGILSRFLAEQEVIAEGEPPQLSPTEMKSVDAGGSTKSCKKKRDSSYVLIWLYQIQS